MPEVYDVLTDPRAYQEALARARALPPQHLAELCRAMKDEAEKATAGLRQKWQDWWDLWLGEVAWPDKEDWQSQVWVSKPFAAVEQATALIQRSLLDSPDFFGVDGQDEDDKVLAAHVWQPLLRLLLDQARFVAKYADACKVGFITGVAGYLKFRWHTLQIPVLAGAQIDAQTGAILPAFRAKTASMLALDFVPPWRIYRDPDSQPRENFSGTYLWHSEWMDRPALRAMVARGWDRQAVERLLAGARDATTDRTLPDSQRAEAERKQQTWERHKFRRSYLIDEGWLDILDEHGDVVLPNALMVHAHGEIVLPPTDAPLWATDMATGRRKWPFVAAAPIAHPTRFEGRGILEPDEGLSLLYSNTLNLTADGMNWEVNPETEVYQPGLVDWTDLRRYPGKAHLKNVREPVIMPVTAGRIDLGKIMAFLQFLDANRENVNFVTQFVQGLPGTRSDITKGEVQIKTAQSLGVFEAMAKNLELGGRACVELAYNFALQYLGGNDYADPSLIRILGAHRAGLLSSLTLAERITALQGNYDFTFTGLSQALQKADLLQKLLQFATLAASPYYAGATKPSQLLRVIAQTLGIMDRVDIYEPAPGPVAPPGLAANPEVAATMRAIGAVPPAAAEEPVVG